MMACSANAAPTILSWMALRLAESSQAIARMAAIPITPKN